MHTLKATSSSSLSLPSGSYIYSICPASPGSFATISSDDSLRLLDASSLKLLNVAKTHKGVTCLREYGSAAGTGQQLLATSGRDGKVRLWDARGSGSPALEMETAKNAAVLSLACNAETNSVVAGTELVSSLATVAIWDIRSPKQVRQQYVESHNDDVTELQYHPTRNNILLSGSTDGLVNVYDTTIIDEDDTLRQVINHGSIHHAGFLSEQAIYALSHDEVFSIYPATDPEDERSEPPSPLQFGDLRQPLSCEYVVQILGGSQGSYLAAGNTTEQRLDLVPLVARPTWRFDQSDIWRLPGAHGEEIVRSVYLDEQSRTVFTCGEDGFVRAWKPAEESGEGDEEKESNAQTPSSKPSSGTKEKKKKQKEKERFKPY
ncbi:hypothetical protein VTN00DRAFT_9220 [Thermoascus crustaceus]|uniref:uncharacterized protein n=1 Tax=Thermoascus crustaceus TaxID=5088 RepID=UPI003741FF05